MACFASAGSGMAKFFVPVTVKLPDTVTAPAPSICRRLMLLVPRMIPVALIVPMARPLPAEESISFQPPSTTPKRLIVRAVACDWKLMIAVSDFVWNAAFALAVLLGFSLRTIEFASTLWNACSHCDGLAVPTPTLPLAEMSTELVGAPGRMRSGRREPPVRSRTNQLASFAPMSHVCAVKPPPLVCSWRMAGVSVAVMCRFRPGELLPKPTLPLEAMNSEFVGAPAIVVNGVLLLVMSSMENLFKPPLLESFAVSCQLLFGKPDDVLVSWNLMRVLFSLRRIVSKPNDSLTTQSRPTQRLPWMISSSAVTTSFAETFDGGLTPFAVTFGVLPTGGASTRSVRNEPLRIENAPAWTTGSPMPASALIFATAASSSAARAAARRCFTSSEIFGSARSSYTYVPSATMRGARSATRNVARLPWNSRVTVVPFGAETTSTRRSNAPDDCHSTAAALMVIFPTGPAYSSAKIGNATIEATTIARMIRAFMEPPPTRLVNGRTLTGYAACGLVLPTYVNWTGSNIAPELKRVHTPARETKIFFRASAATPTRWCWEAWRRCRKPRDSRRALR